MSAFGKRIQVRILVLGTTERGLSLVDDQNNRYHWITRQYNHPLFYMKKCEWVNVSMTVYSVQGVSTIVKNVRILTK